MAISLEPRAPELAPAAVAVSAGADDGVDATEVPTDRMGAAEPQPATRTSIASVRTASRRIAIRSMMLLPDAAGRAAGRFATRARRKDIPDRGWS